MSKKEEFLKERFKLALDSTYKVLSEDLDKIGKKKNYKETNENISAKYLDMLKQNFENYIDDYKLETIGLSLIHI